jgi:hypothetical protein
VKVKRSFPLTSVETVEYDETKDPTKFQLVFSNSIEILQAETTEEASDWVEKIVEGYISVNYYVCIILLGYEKYSFLSHHTTACTKWHPSLPLEEESYYESGQAAKPEIEEEVASKSPLLPDPALAKDEQSTQKRESSCQNYSQV